MRWLYWWWRVRWTCPHPDHRVLCLHGDAVMFHSWKRGYCLECGAYLNELPPTCKFTGRPHASRG
jgi:hypothetical protein